MGGLCDLFASVACRGRRFPEPAAADFSRRRSRFSAPPVGATARAARPKPYDPPRHQPSGQLSTRCRRSTRHLASHACTAEPCESFVRMDSGSPCHAVFFIEKTSGFRDKRRRDPYDYLQGIDVYVESVFHLIDTLSTTARMESSSRDTSRIWCCGRIHRHHSSPVRSSRYRGRQRTDVREILRSCVAMSRWFTPHSLRACIGWPVFVVARHEFPLRTSCEAPCRFRRFGYLELALTSTE